MFLLIVASWVNREQQQKIEYLETQLAVLKEQFGNKRILLTDGQRRRLAHYRSDRSHQGLGNQLIVPLEHPPEMKTQIETTERLGGLLRSYRRAA